MKFLLVTESPKLSVLNSPKLSLQRCVYGKIALDNTGDVSYEVEARSVLWSR